MRITRSITTAIVEGLLLGVGAVEVGQHLGESLVETRRHFDIEFERPEPGVAPGQAVVCYDADERVVGGGWITKSFKTGAETEARQASVV